MKRILLLGLILLYAQLVNAQCDVVFARAKNYYESKDYANAKAQFQKVVDYNCDSYKDIAKEYIKVCNEWIRVNEKERQANNLSVLDSQLKELEEENNNLATEKASLETTISSLKATNLTLLTMCEGKDAEIKNLQDSITNKLLPFVQGKESFDASLRDSILVLGNELNEYLRNKTWLEWRTVDKKQITDCDKNSDLPTMISVIGKNLKLLTKKK